MGLRHLTDDPRYSTNAARVENRPSLVATLQDAFLTRTYEEWEAVLDAAGIPVGAINTLDQVVKHPQVAARGALASCDHPIAGALKVVGPPVRLSETPGAIRRPAPLLGQHTDEVLRTLLGLEDAAIEQLRQAGAIGSHSRR
jgi:CoA:oxalate CoA-transferase